MFTLRCTARLLKRTRITLATAPTETTTRLGDWYANVIHVGRRQLVVAVSEKTLLPVVVPAAPHATLVPRLRVAITNVLRGLGISPDDIARENTEMAEVAYGKTNSKQVVGILTEFAFLLPHFVPSAGSLIDLSLKLAETPCSPLYKTTTSPDRTTIALFNEPALRVVH